MRKLHLFLIAGEESGDTHGANLLEALHAYHPAIEAVGLGGEHMEKAGMKLRRDMKKDLAIIGLAGVVTNFPKIARVFKDTEAYLQQHRPDALILIDYPGFNIRMAQRAKNLGIPVIWYISPQVWAWKKGRIKTLARTVDLMLLIFPFEILTYKGRGINTVHVGHPLFDEITLEMTREEVYKFHGLDTGKALVTLVPGSRKREVRDFLHIMLQGALRYRETHPDTQFAVIRATTIDEELLHEIIARENLPFTVKVVSKHRHDLRKHADFSWVKSGTSTLEAAILGAPHLIVYKVSWLTWVIGKQLLTNSVIGLPNIVADKQIVPELLQDEFTPLNLAEQTAAYLDHPDQYARMVDDLRRVKEKLGGPGASRRAARAILKLFGIDPDPTDTTATRDRRTFLQRDDFPSDHYGTNLENQK